MSRRSWFAVAPAALLMVSGCDGGFALVRAEATEDELCQEQAEQSVEGVPVEAHQSIETGVNYDASAMVAQLSQNGFDSDVQLSSFTIVATEGLSDLSFIDALDVSIGEEGAADGGSENVLSYQKPAQASAIGKSITALPKSAVNLASAAQNGSLAIKLRLDGTLPQSSWKMTTKPCLKAKVSFSLKP